MAGFPLVALRPAAEAIAVDREAEAESEQGVAAAAVADEWRAQLTWLRAVAGGRKQQPWALPQCSSVPELHCFCPSSWLCVWLPLSCVSRPWLCSRGVWLRSAAGS